MGTQKGFTSGSISHQEENRSPKYREIKSDVVRVDSSGVALKDVVKDFDFTSQADGVITMTRKAEKHNLGDDLPKRVA